MINITVDTREVSNKLKILSTSLNKDIETTYKELASLTASKLAYICQPYGMGNKQRDILRKAVLKDVSSSYWDIGRTANEIKKLGGQNMQAAFLTAVHAGDWTRAEEVVKNVIKNIDDFRTQAEPSHLNKNRKGHPRKRVLKEPSSAQVVMSNSSINTLKSKHVVNAGMAKAGWADIVSKLSPQKRIAKWVKRAGLGSYKIIKNGAMFILSITNEVRYASAVLGANDIQKAISQSVNNHINRMERMIEATCKKF